MRAPFLRALLFLVLLLPSAQFAWRNRDMPQFAYLHDDGLFFVSAKSVASGTGYRIASLPEAPAQTKYPPLYPVWLSLIWRMNPRFPGNLQLATLFSWLTLVACLALAHRLFRRLFGKQPEGERTAWILTALLGISPFMILFGTSMFSEVPFTCLVLAALLLSDGNPSDGNQRNGRIAAAGILAGCAYLCRTAGIALVLGIPLSMILVGRLVGRQKGQSIPWRRIGIFLATSLPAVAGWTLWTATHRLGTQDSTLLYYVDYIHYQFVNVGWDNFAVVLWKNADELLYGMGALVLPKLETSPPVKMLTEALGVAMISGVVRLLRQGKAASYAAFAGLSILMLLVWHFPPNERLVLPLFPLLLAGLYTEMQHLWTMLRSALQHRDKSQRAVARLFGTAIAGILAIAVGLQIYMALVFMNQTAALQRAKLADRKAAYQFIATQLPPTSAVLSYDDPLLYLYTNRQGNYLPLLPRWWYAEDHQKIVAEYQDVAAYCRRRGLDYFYFTTEDLSRETGEDDRKAIETAVRQNPELVPVYTAGIGTVYRVLALPPGTSKIAHAGL